MTNDEITTEDLLNMRVVPEQQADLAAVMNAFGLAPSLEGLTAEEQIANLTRQRDAWRHDALTAEQRIDALNERLADRDAQLDQAKTARARDLVRYSQDEMFLRLMAAEADRDAAEAALAQLTSITPLATPVGGQEKPNDATPQLANCTTCGATDAECRTVMGQTGAVRSCCARCKMTDTHPAAPVGGQAEPSDAAKHTIAWTLDANRGCIEGRITCHAGPGDPCHRACRCEDASCYCGGATMEDIDFCNPLAFIENEDDVSLIERYDGADETLRDGPVELVWMPDGETYGWRYAAAAVSGEQR